MVRLLLLLAIFHRFIIGGLDAKGAYMNSCNFMHLLCVWPPKELVQIHITLFGKLWCVFRLLYGIFKAGYQRRLVIEFWLLNEIRLFRIRGASQLYIKKDLRGYALLLLANVKNEILMAGTIEVTEWLSRWTEASDLESLLSMIQSSLLGV